MKIKIPKKRVTLDDLALMVAKGFENTATKDDIKRLGNDIKRLDKKIDLVKLELKREIQSLRNSVNNHLKLSDRRYLELKHNQKILAKYLKIVIEKSKIPVDLKELEMVLK